MTAPRKPFAHLEAELAGARTGWVTPVLALAGVVVVVVLASTLLPVPDTSRDFRNAADSGDGDAGHATLAWSDLVPADWDATREMKRLQRTAAGIDDTAPEARASFARLRDVLDAAPANPALQGRAVRIPGYVVPLDPRAKGLTEFLLVPYFGACIHSPPPPANQVIHVQSAKPLALRAMDTVWVAGTLDVVQHTSSVAVSGYRLHAVSADPYQPGDPPREASR
ncbi:MAG: DUF3299 domain-containing protein [Rhizobacter sp.]